MDKGKLLTEINICGIISTMGELISTAPDSAPLQGRDLSIACDDLLDHLMAFIQGNDGFIGEGHFDFFGPDGYHYSGLFENRLDQHGELIDITRHGEEAYDHTVVANNPGLRRIRYSDFNTGETLPLNTFGAYRKGRAITDSPRQPAPAI